MKHYPIQKNIEMTDEIYNVLHNIREKRNFNSSQYIKEKIKLIRKYYQENKLEGAVVGLSGGIDSAVVAYLMVLALGKENVICITLPSIESGMSNVNDSIERANKVMESLNVDKKIINMSPIINVILDEFKKNNLYGDNWAEGQLVAYARTPVLYYITSVMSSLNKKYIIAGTTNLSEGAYLGYVGKASDGMVDIQVIADIHKSEVISVAEELGIPRSILKTTPSGDMYDGRSDEEVFGAPYDFVELYMHYISSRKEKQKKILSNFNEYDLKVFNFYKKNLDKLHKFNKHKYKVGSPAYSLDIKDLIFFKKEKFGWGIFTYD